MWLIILGLIAGSIGSSIIVVTMESLQRNSATIGHVVGVIFGGAFGISSLYLVLHGLRQFMLGEITDILKRISKETK